MSIQGNYLNLNYKLGLNEILTIGDNYLSYITSTTQYLHAGVTTFMADLSITIYHLVWVITYIIICLAVVIHTLSNNIIFFQEYRSTLLITTPNAKE